MAKQEITPFKVDRTLNTEAEEQFIFEMLWQFSVDLEEALVNQAENYKLIDTWELVHSIKKRFHWKPSGTMIQFSFADQGRFQDMGVGRGKSIGKIEDIDTNNIVWGIKPKMKRKPKRWYTRTIYGYIYRLTDLLRYGYSEEIQARIKQKLIAEKGETYYNL